MNLVEFMRPQIEEVKAVLVQNLTQILHHEVFSLVLEVTGISIHVIGYELEGYFIILLKGIWKSILVKIVVFEKKIINEADFL